MGGTGFAREAAQPGSLTDDLADCRAERSLILCQKTSKPPDDQKVLQCGKYGFDGRVEQARFLPTGYPDFAKRWDLAQLARNSHDNHIGSGTVVLDKAHNDRGPLLQRGLIGGRKRHQHDIAKS